MTIPQKKAKAAPSPIIVVYQDADGLNLYVKGLPATLTPILVREDAYGEMEAEEMFLDVLSNAPAKVRRAVKEAL